jgi:enamine deaminase RidA (YjgF/YER057c/UK114 family)
MPLRDPNNSKRYLHSTSTKYEFQFGYSRAVRHGRVIRVAGTAGLNDDGQVVSSDVVDQMRAAIEIIKRALEDLGSSLSDVIMTRIYVHDVHDIDRVAVIHGEVFRDIRPATTIVRVDFIDERILVEIEAEAVYGGADAKD